MQPGKWLVARFNSDLAVGGTLAILQVRNRLYALLRARRYADPEALHGQKF